MTLIERISKICGMIPTNVSKILDNLDNIENKKRAIQHIIWHLPDGLVKDKERDELIKELNILAETPEEREEIMNTIIDKINEGGDIVLERDLDINEPKFTSQYGQCFQLRTESNVDLNNKTITCPGEINPNLTGGPDCFWVFKSSSLSNGSIDCKRMAIVSIAPQITIENMDIKGGYCCDVAGGIMEIKSGNFEALVEGGSCLQVEGGKCIIYDGTFKSIPDEKKGIYYTLNLKDILVKGQDPEVVKPTDFIEVRGGRFYKFDPSNTLTEPDPYKPCSFVPDGYKVIQNGDWFEVVSE